MATFHKTLHGHISPADKARSDYAYISFELPFDASHVHVSYDYSARMTADRVEGGNVIDVGLFDPRGSGFPGGLGFRGWSGSARREFFVGENDATPGYLPGPLPAGRYEVILGLYRIWPQGANYEIEIEATSAEGPVGSVLTMPPLQENVPVSDVIDDVGPIWLRGDLQSHTYHSDAKGSPALLVSKARDLGLDFLAITDHNTVSHHAELPKLADDKLLLIPGQEVTTYYGHMNVWGTSRWCDFRARSADDLATIIELAHEQGAVCSINHPKAGGPAWEYGFDHDVQAMEVWQGPWPYRNAESLALWDRLLCQGRRLPAVGGSDYHCPEGEETNLLRLGQPTTWVHARDRSVAAILAGICAGRSSISASPQGPRLDFVAETRTGRAIMGGTLTISAAEDIALTISIVDGSGYKLCIVADGSVVEEHEVSSASAEVRTTVTAATYIRCELVADMPRHQLPDSIPATLDLHDWRWALSNPIYLRTRSK